MSSFPLVFAALVVLGAALVLAQQTLVQGRWGINLSRPDCPGCGTPTPALRRPGSLRQALWGGWTCRTCGTEVDKWGRRVGPGAAS